MSRIQAVVICALAAVIMYCGMQITDIMSEYKKASDIYSGLRDIVVASAPTPTPAGSANPAESAASNTTPGTAAQSGTVNTEAPDFPEGEEDDEPGLLVNFELLHELNRDAVGWIYIPDSDVNYPLMHGIDNDTYLYTAYDGTSSGSGSIFLDYRNDANLTDKHNIIHGHNMYDGSMFGRLYKYRDYEYMQEHRYIYVLLPEVTLKYEVFSHHITDVNENSYRVSFTDSGDFADYIKYLKDQSEYQSGVIPDAEANVLTLSTCIIDDDDSRRVIHATLVKVIRSKKWAVDNEEWAEESDAIVIMTDEPEPTEEPEITDEPAEDIEEAGKPEDEFYDETYDEAYDEAYNETNDEAYVESYDDESYDEVYDETYEESGEETYEDFTENDDNLGSDDGVEQGGDTEPDAETEQSGEAEHGSETEQSDTGTAEENLPEENEQGYENLPDGEVLGEEELPLETGGDEPADIESTAEE